MRNPYPEQHDTHERQGGDGNTFATGEKHNQPKAQTVPAEKRFSGSENTPLANSPGRVNEDVSEKE
jgi:hypothetical protein